MPDRSNLAYICDGSLEGILCCIFESYVRKELPAEILSEERPTFYPTRQVVSDEGHARRVWRALEKMGGEVAFWVMDGWCAQNENGAQIVFDFIRQALTYGASVTGMLADCAVQEMFCLVRTQRNEAHHYKEFLRFAAYGGALVSVIEPKCFVLQALAPHFSDRFPEETFLIFDQTHGLALFYRPYESVLREVSELELPELDERERAFRGLWRQYYETIAIEGRYNPTCRRTLMPKHFWAHMLEMDTDERQRLADAEAAKKQSKTLLTGRGYGRPAVEEAVFVHKKIQKSE